MSDCPLEKMPCKISIPNGQSFTFDLVPKGLPVMESLALSVTGLEGVKEPLKVWFEGKNMYMGMHYMLPVLIKPQLHDQQDFQGIIPVCSLDKEMVWLLNFDIPIKNNVFNIQFQLKPMSGD